MKNITSILWRIRDLIFSFGFPPYRYLGLSETRYDTTYSICKAVKQTTGRDPYGRYVVIGPIGEIFTFARESSGRVSGRRYDTNLIKRIPTRKL
jgi:hypothetical protein